MSTPPKLEMIFDINVLEHLGLKMYTSLPAVVAEFVANSWDAGAHQVDINIPEAATVDANYAVSIRDDGCGMTIDEVRRKFLVIGRARRIEEGTDTVTMNGQSRRVMGRKGIGKLAGFGVAGQVLVTTTRQRQYVEFVMDYDEMRNAALKANGENKRASYLPRVEGWGKTKEPNGTLIELRQLKRTQKPDVQVMRKHLARRFSITGAEHSFRVNVNGDEIKPADRELRNRCEHLWTIDENVSDGKDWRVTGWIGTMANPVTDDFELGIVLMARGKMVQSPTTFEVSPGFTGQFALSYLVGELNAEFLDEETDEVSTHRSSIVWDSEKGQALLTWGQNKVRGIANQWVDKRTSVKTAVVQKAPLYAARIANLPDTERRIIDGFLKKLMVREDVTTDTVLEVADFMATGAEYKGFLELVEAIEESSPEKPEVIMKFLREWEVIDAVEMARIVEGRLQAIAKFQSLIDTDAKERPDIHNFLVDNPWLLDPTWNYIDDETRYSELLKKQFPESEDAPPEERRIDFLCLGYGNVLNVIEIKRPSLKMKVKELRQLQDYVNFAKGMHGTGRRSYDSVVGYLIGGSVSQDYNTSQMKEQWGQLNMYILTYEELRSTAIKSHRRFLDVIQRKADRTKDLRVKESSDRLRKVFEVASGAT